MTCTNRVISAVGDEHVVFALLDAKDTFQSLAYSPPVASDSFVTVPFLDLGDTILSLASPQTPWLPLSSASEPRVPHLCSGETVPALLGSR